MPYCERKGCNRFGWCCLFDKGAESWWCDYHYGKLLRLFGRRQEPEEFYCDPVGWLERLVKL